MAIGVMVGLREAGSLVVHWLKSQVSAANRQRLPMNGFPLLNLKSNEMQMRCRGSLRSARTGANAGQYFQISFPGCGYPWRSLKSGHTLSLQNRPSMGSSALLVNHGWHFAEGVRGGTRKSSSGGFAQLAMEPRTLLPDAGEVVLDRLQVYGRDRLVMVLRPVAKGSCCPACQRISRRTHSWYSRGLAICPGRAFRSASCCMCVARGGHGIGVGAW